MVPVLLQPGFLASCLVSFFQDELSAADAIMLFAIYDIGTTLLEVPSGYMSDWFGRRITLTLSASMAVAGCLLLGFGSGFYVFALAQVFLGAGTAFASGTDSALLYESLAQENRSDEIASHELRAWRMGFAALAISALSGGLLSAHAPTWPFLATAIAAAVSVFITLRFREPVHADNHSQALPVPQQARAISNVLRNPVVAWFFILSAGMYVLGHVPFVFGQGFILDALSATGLAGDATIVSGSVTAAMMLVSVAASWIAIPMRRILGFGILLLTALSLQIGLIGVLAMATHPLAIGLLLLRMVPDALTRAFVMARVQPLLKRQYRATYWSLTSLVGRVILASSLLAASTETPVDGLLSHATLQDILQWYIAAGLLLLATLAVTIKFPNQGSST